MSDHLTNERINKTPNPEHQSFQERLPPQTALRRRRQFGLSSIWRVGSLLGLATPRELVGPLIIRTRVLRLLPTFAIAVPLDSRHYKGTILEIARAEG